MSAGVQMRGFAPSPQLLCYAAGLKNKRIPWFNMVNKGSCRGLYPQYWGYQTAPKTGQKFPLFHSGIPFAFLFRK
jgi:hypothetical protein